MNQVCPYNFSPWEILLLLFTFYWQKCHSPSDGYLQFIYTYGVNSDISHSRIKEAMDTNLLKVAGSSETARTLALCDHIDSIRTTLLRLLAYCCLNAIQEQHKGFTQTTTKGDDYNCHKANLQLSPREKHWQTLLHSLVYTTTSFLHILYSHIIISA